MCVCVMCDCALDVRFIKRGEALNIALQWQPFKRSRLYITEAITSFTDLLVIKERFMKSGVAGRGRGGR